MSLLSAAAQDEDGDIIRALRAENDALKQQLMAATKSALDHVQRNRELEAMLAAVGAGGVEPLMPGKPADCIPRNFNTWSPNEGDTWYEHPADAQIIEDVFGGDMPVVGGEYEVIAGWCGVKARYRITSVSEDGDCEVECISHQQAAAAPQPPVVEQPQVEQEAARLYRENQEPSHAGR